MKCEKAIYKVCTFKSSNLISPPLCRKCHFNPIPGTGFFGVAMYGEEPSRPAPCIFSVFCPFDFKCATIYIQPFLYGMTVIKSKMVQRF